MIVIEMFETISDPKCNKDPTHNSNEDAVHTLEEVV
jgi:hypothetical protein